MALTINLKSNLSPLHRAIVDLSGKQTKFAAALALTKLAQGISAAETEAVKQTFDNPTPFTQKGFFVKPATKGSLTAYVSAKDIQAEYLAPYVFGGDRSLGKKLGMLAPKNISLNQYGNLPRNKLKTLMGRKDVFVGKIQLKSGSMVSGVWQRPAVAGRRSGKRTRKGAAPQAQADAPGIKLLIRFEDSTPVKKHFAFAERARAYVARHAADEFQAALRRAFASASPRR